MKSTKLRKAITTFITATMVVSMVGSAFATASADAYKKGDPNGDDQIKMTDVVLTQRHIAQLEEFDEQKTFAADVTYDGLVKLDDVVAMQRYIAGLITEFKAPEEKKIEVGSTVTFKNGSVNDAAGAKVDTFERYALYTVTEINGENAKLEATYLFNGHTSIMTHEVKLADLELSETALDFGEVSTELRVGSAVIINESAIIDKEEAPISILDRRLVYKVTSISTDSDATVEVEANYVLKGGIQYKDTKSLSTQDLSLYTGTEATWGIEGSETNAAAEVGGLAYIKKDAKTYAGENIANFWFLCAFDVESIEGDKAVLRADVKYGRGILSMLDVSTQEIADLINANKEALTSIPAEDVIDVLARFGVKISNVEKLNSLMGMIKTTTITADMLDLAISTLNYSIRFEVNTADLIGVRLQ